MTETISTYYARIKLETEEQWLKLKQDIPFLQFKPDWQVKIIPPFGGATARFHVKKADSDKLISVYLDHFARLGCMSEPYYEIFPDQYGDVSRFTLTETEEMLEEIEASLNLIETEGA